MALFSTKITLLPGSAVFALSLFACGGDSGTGGDDTIKPGNSSAIELSSSSIEIDDPGSSSNSQADRYNWVQTTQNITYAADGITETIRQENTYDADGRETGMVLYMNGVLNSQYRDYQYDGRTVTFWNDHYSEGILQSGTKMQRTYIDQNWVQTTQNITYAADGITETIRQENTYDADGRETGMVLYMNGVLSSQYRDYQYNGRTVTFWNDHYLSGVLQSGTKMQRIYR